VRVDEAVEAVEALPLSRSLTGTGRGVMSEVLIQRELSHYDLGDIDIRHNPAREHARL
jgi:hypothetical protein